MEQVGRIAGQARAFRTNRDARRRSLRPADRPASAVTILDQHQGKRHCKHHIDELEMDVLREPHRDRPRPGAAANNGTPISPSANISTASRYSATSAPKTRTFPVRRANPVRDKTRADPSRNTAGPVAGRRRGRRSFPALTARMPRLHGETDQGSVKNVVKHLIGDAPRRRVGAIRSGYRFCTMKNCATSTLPLIPLNQQGGLAPAMSHSTKIGERSAR